MFKDTHTFSSFSVNDLAAAKEFYARTLGVIIVDNGEMGFMMRFTGGNAVFVYPKSDHIPATFTVLNFLTHDIDEIVDELMTKSIEMERYEDMHQDEKGIMRGIQANRGPDIAWFKDPAGNIISVLQDK